MFIESEQLFSLPLPGEKSLGNKIHERTEKSETFLSNARFCGYTGGSKFVTDKTEREIKGGKFQGNSPDGRYIFSHFDKNSHLQVFVPYNSSEHSELNEWYERGEEIPGIFRNPSFHAIHIHPSLSETSLGKGEITFRTKLD